MTDTHGSGTEPAGEQDASGAPPAPQQQPQPYPQTYPQTYAPPPTQAYGQPYGQVHGVPPGGAAPPGHYPYGQQPYGQYAPQLYAQPGYGPPGYGLRDPHRRPGTVLAAGIVTLVLSGITLLLAGMMLFGVVVASAEFIDGFTGEAGLDSADEDSLFVVIVVVLAVMVIWCSAAIVLAILTLRRVNWARITLVVSASVTVAVSLVAIGGGASVVTLLGGIAVIILLFTGGAGEWYRRADADDPALPSY